MFILKLAWKNIWRNRLRSSVIITAIIIGVWAGIFLSAFSIGMTKEYVASQLNTFIGHVSIENTLFEVDKKVSFTLSNVDEILFTIAKQPSVIASTSKTLATGLASSSSSNFGVQLNGIEPESFKKVHLIHEDLIEGDFFTTQKRNPILVGAELAHRLRLKLNSKVVLTFQDVNGEITGAAFRVIGIFKTINTMYDKSNVFVLQSDLQRLLNAPDAVHQISVKLDDFRKASTWVKPLVNNWENTSLKEWELSSPELSYMDSATTTTLFIFMSIIVLALALAILNTMLMAILERTKELGMLMAVGMKPYRLFMLILSETLFLSIIGAPIAIFLSWVTIYFFSTNGLNLSQFSEGLSMYGINPIIYPQVPLDYYVSISLMILGATFLAALIPAYKSIKLNPIEAIRKS